MKSLSRRGKIRFISYNIALILVLALFGAVKSYEAGYFKLQQEHQYSQSLNELSEYMNNIEVSLGKTIFVNTEPMMTSISSSILREASGAKDALGRLPTNSLNLENIYRFLSQAGSYSISLSKKVSAGEKLTEEEHNSIIELYNYAKEISDYIDGTLMNTDVSALALEQLNNRSYSGTNEATPVLSGFEEFDESIASLPSLIYDGPFSDSIGQSDPKLTSGRNEVSASEALKIAAEFCRIPEESFKQESDTGGNLPCYNFYTDNLNISVTKQGGLICYMLDSSFCGEITITAEEAAQIASEALANEGLTNMKQSYYAVEDGICTVNFAYENNGIVYYPDLIKIGISMDDGDIVFFDAKGFIMNHYDRELPEKKYTAEQAASVLSSHLEVIGQREAVIPTDGENEVYCYEFHCKSKYGIELLVYIDVKTCTEADILIMLKTDNGVFTM